MVYYTLGVSLVQQRFIDREKELRVLDKAYSERPGLVVVYGRRRVGKTRLVLEWLKKLPSTTIYYHAIPASHEVNLKSLANSVASQAGLGFFAKIGFESLDSLLEALAEARRDAVVVIDEFTYWVRGSPRVAGELQRFADHVLPGTRMLIVLVGSLLGVMMGSVLGGGSPLYGRASAKLVVEPLEPWTATSLHPWLGLEDAVRVYALFGGIPYYHSLVRPGSSLEEILRDSILSPTTPLRDEIVFMLRDELQNPAPYLSILDAIANGRNRVSEISSYTGIPVQHLPRYLSTLELLGFVERVVPLGSKRGWYRIRDAPTRTWFRIVRPLAPLIDSGRVEEALQEAVKALEGVMGEVFEEIAQRYAQWLASRGAIRYTAMGRWARKGVEIDLLAVDEEHRRVYAFEAKWAVLDQRSAERLAKRLGEKLAQTPFAEWDKRLFIIARGYRGPGEPSGAKIVTLADMPFEKGSPSRARERL